MFPNPLKFSIQDASCTLQGCEIQLKCMGGAGVWAWPERHLEVGHIGRPTDTNIGVPTTST